MRRSREVTAPLHGEVVGPGTSDHRPVAWPEAPVAVRTRDGRQEIHLHESHVHHHHAAPASPADGIRWHMLAAYAMGIAVLLAVIVALIAGGVIDLHALRPPWQEKP